MRNLILIRNFIANDPALTTFCRCQIFTDYSSWKSAYVSIANAQGEVHLWDTNYDSIFTSSCSLDLKEISHINWSKDTFIVGLQLVNELLYVTLNFGIFVIIPLPNPSVDDTISFDTKINDITQVFWSADCEKSILLRASSVISILDVPSEGEEIIDISLQDVEEENNRFVSVGWGSTETQFRGSEGKLSKQVKEETAPRDETSNAVLVVWKKDSSAFAVSYECRREEKRKVKIFNRNGVLLNVTRDVYGLEAVMDWCPSKNLISHLQILPNKSVICFLEENGLRHGEFLLPNTFKIERLIWNNEGSILATLGTELESGLHSVFLYTTSNYKWYMKQKLEFEKRIIHLQWDDLVQNRLHLVFETGMYRMYEWTFEVIESNECIVKKCDSKIIVNINGTNVHTTSYGTVFRPPSLPERICSVQFYVNAVIFGKGTGNAAAFKYSDALLYLSNNTLLCCDLSADTNLAKDYFKFSLSGGTNERKPIRFSTTAEITACLWLPRNKNLYFCWTRSDGYYFCVSYLCSEARQCVIHEMIKVNSRILVVFIGDCDVFVHLESGAILMYENGKLHSSQIQLREPCRRIAVVNRTTMVALSENRNLYVNDRIKWRDIRSFYWRPPFLVALTSNNRLVMATNEKKSLTEILSRRVEPKSHLVAIVGDQVLLEIDRGNIELITPRPFAAVKMAAELAKERYFDAFKFLRKQRINLSVLFDHDPAKFLKNVRSIIEHVQDPSYLTLFVMELENTNIAHRMFPWKYDDEVNELSATNSKMLLVCEALLTVMEEMKCVKLVLPAITALVRLNKLALAAKHAVDNNEIHFLFQLADSRAIYEAVIASYDLSCALKIAEFSKMDPSDYLPFIKRLQKMDENLRKFSVNDYLEKRAEALKYLSECEQDCYFEECAKYIEKHKLYSAGFQIFSAKLSASINKEDQAARTANVRYNKITALFADSLHANQEFEEAAMLYEKARMNDRALECYLLSGNWHAIISLVHSMYLNESDAKNWYLKLHSSLTLKRQYEDAAFVALVFLKDGWMASKDYLTARNYRKAVDAARTFNTLSVALSLLKPKLLEDAKNYISDFQSHASTLRQHAKRLDEINCAEKNGLLQAEENVAYSDRESCSSSESTTTYSTRSSRRSNISLSSSAKRVRRRERKLWNLKPGNPREKPSLINAIRELIYDCDRDYSNRLPDLVDALITSDEHELARELHVKYSSFSKHIEQIIHSVWNPDEVNEEGGFKDLSLKCPPNRSTIANRNSLINILSL